MPVNNKDKRIKARRRQRIEEARRRRRRQVMIQRMAGKVLPPAVGVALLVVIIVMGGRFLGLNSHAETGKPKDSGIKEMEQHGGNDSQARDLAYYWNGGENGAATEESQGDVGAVTAQSNGQGNNSNTTSGENTGQAAGSPAENQPIENPKLKVKSASATAGTKQLGEELVSSHAIVIDLNTDTILAQKDAMTRINPASMTKILTVLVAAEHVTNLEDTVTITLDITDYSYVNDCSNTGFLENETVTVRDLFYGTILPSGADAAAALATYVAGSLDGFVNMMNEKLAQLGLSETAHMTNCVGLYDENHYCTVYDMAMILEAAMENDLCREVMSAHTYTTSATEQHPEGITISNWFLRRIEDKDTGGEVLCAKTGYVVQSGNCAASYGVDSAGKPFICVTANASSAWRCIYDHVALYKQFATPTGE